MRWALCTARPMPPVSPCAPWLWSGISTPTGLARTATTRRGARRSTTAMASSITPTGSTTSSSPPPWEGENYEPRNPMESGIFKGALDEVSSTTPRDQAGGRGVLRSVEQRIRAVALGFASYHQPFDPRPLACGDGPDTPHGKGLCQSTAFGGAHHDLLPHGLGMAGQGTYLVRSLTTQHVQSRARPSPLAPLLRHAHLRLAHRHVGVRRYLRRIAYPFSVQSGAKRPIPSVQRVTGQQIEGHAMGFDPFDHLQAQGDCRLERALRRDTQSVAGLGEGCPKPLFRQEQFAIHHRPQPTVRIRQAGVDPTDIDLAHPAIVLARRSGIVRARFLIRTLIQNQCAPLGQGRRRLDLRLILAEDRWSRPRRVGHKVLQGLSVVTGHVPRHIGTVPFVVHGQLTAQRVVSVCAGVTRAGRETVTKP